MKLKKMKFSYDKLLYITSSLVESKDSLNIKTKRKAEKALNKLVRRMSKNV